MNKIYMENNNDTKYHKMVFIMNAIEDGWRVKKKKSLYIFYKKHNGQREVYNEDYLEEFVKKNMKKIN